MRANNMFVVVYFIHFMSHIQFSELFSIRWLLICLLWGYFDAMCCLLAWWWWWWGWAVVTHQLQVERRTAKERWPETDVLPISHADQPLYSAPKIQRRQCFHQQCMQWVACCCSLPGYLSTVPFFNFSNNVLILLFPQFCSETMS